MRIIPIALLVMTLTTIAETAEKIKLPTFNTFYTYTNINYRNDISFSPGEGAMKGHLKVMGGRCFVDQEVAVGETDEVFLIELKGMTPRNSHDTAFCTGGPVKITMPKNKGITGYQGTIEAWMPGQAPLKGLFTYK